jgi:uncharacterized membrane protein YfcA
MIDQLPLFIFLSLLAEIIGTIGGFGSSLLFVPIASYFLDDFQSVLGVTALFHVCSNLSKIGLFRKGFDKKLIINIGIPSVIFVVIGSVLSNYLDTKLSEKLLSVVLILVCIIIFAFKDLSITTSPRNCIAGGSISGFFAGLVGTGGAIRGVLLSSFGIEKEIFIATSAGIDLAVDSSRAVVYGYNGFIHKHDMYLIPILLVVSIIGTYIGKLLLHKISESLFKYFVLVLVLATALYTLFFGS